MKKNRVKFLVSVAMLSSIAFVLMMLKFPVPPFPAFLKIEFSDIPALIGMLIFGPMAGILVEFFKNVLDYLISGSDTGVPVGRFANFVSGIFYILPTYYIYNKLKTKKGMVVALIISTVLMSIVMSVLNYYVLLPAYYFFLNMPVMSGSEVTNYIVAGILPFNIVKGVAISLVFMLLFTRMSTWIQKQHTSFN